MFPGNGEFSRKDAEAPRELAEILLGSRLLGEVLARAENLDRRRKHCSSARLRRELLIRVGQRKIIFFVPLALDEILVAIENILR